jgi:hypothetical protein
MDKKENFNVIFGTPDFDKKVSVKMFQDSKGFNHIYIQVQFPKLLSIKLDPC